MNKRDRDSGRPGDGDETIVGDALGRMARTFRHGEEYGSIGGRDSDALLACCEWIGHTLGLAVKVPPRLPEHAEHINQKLDFICRKSGMRYRQVRLPERWWHSPGEPLLCLRLDDPRPVVVASHAGEPYRVIDPVNGDAERLDAALAENLLPIAYTFYRGFPEATPLRSFFNIAVPGNQRTIAWIFLFAALAAIFALFSPFVQKTLFDKVIPDNDYSSLAQLIFGLVVIAFNMFCFQIASSFAALQLEGILQNRFGAALWDRMLRLPLSFYRQYATGDVIQRVGVVEETRKVIGGYALRTTLAALFGLLYLIPMIYYSWRLTLIGVTVLGGSFLMILVYLYYRLSIQRKLLVYKARISKFLIQAIQGVTKIRVAGEEQHAMAHWMEMFGGSQALEYHVRKVGNVVGVVSSGLRTISLLAIYVMVIVLIQREEMAAGFTIGTYMAFMNAYTPFSQSVSDLLGVMTSYFELVPAWERSRVIFDSQTESEGAKHPVVGLKGGLHIDGVYFRYEENGPLILRDFQLRAEPGQFVGIVGASGCGKSTLVRLLMGFETVERGHIYYDHQDLEHLDPEQLRRELGVVLQTSQVFAGSAYDNIVCGRSCSSEDVQEAVALSRFDEVLADLPMGLDTVLTSGGGTLSGGQKQRLLIARALVTKPRVLILDEATSALDNRTQELISKNLAGLEVTRLVIAHRLSTIRDADKIVVVSEGAVIEEGTFDQLAKRDGQFSKLLKLQQL